MATLPEQLLGVLFVFAILFLMHSAPVMVKLLSAFGLSYSCYIWSCEYLYEMHVCVIGAWNARHLHKLSKTCRNYVGVTEITRLYPWYERHLQCTGELWGLEAWRAYRHYTAPHYLLLYVTVTLSIYFIYCIVKQVGRLLNKWFDNQAPAEQDTALFENALALPGSYHNIFSLSHIAKLNNEFKNELCEARKRTPCSCEGLDIELMRTEKNFLQRDLETARGMETYHKDELHKLQLVLAKDGCGHQKLLSDMRREILALRSRASSSKATQRTSCNVAPFSESVDKKDAGQAALRRQSAAIEQQKSAPKTTALSSSSLARSTPRNRQLMTDKLTRELNSTKEKLDSVENALDSTTSELRRANEELAAKKAELEQRDSELDKVHGALKNNEAHLRSKAADSQKAQDKAASVEKALQETKELLASKHQELQHAQNELTSTKTTVDSEFKDVERVKTELDRANARAQDYENKGLKLEHEFNIQKKILEDTKKDLNMWGNESNKQRNEIITELRPEILRLQDELAKGQSGHDEYVRKTRRIIEALEQEKQLLQRTQNSVASQTEIARLQRILADEQPIRRDAQHQVHELQKAVDRFGAERAFYQQQYNSHHVEVEKLKQELAESASRLIRISAYNDVQQLNMEIDQLKTAAQRREFECKADREKWDKAKENATEQIKKLRKEVKDSKDQLKAAKDAAKEAWEGLEQLKQLRSEVAEKEKQLQLEKNKAEAVEIARKYLLSKGLAKTQEYQAFKEDHARKAQAGLGAGEDDATEKRGRDGIDSGEDGKVPGARDPKRQQV